MYEENRYKICILYHLPERELDSCLMIAESIKKLNPKTKVLVEEFFRGISLVLTYKPNVILTIPPREIYASNLLTIVKKVTNCAILSLLTEGYYQDFSDERVQISVGTNQYSPYLVDRYLFWGEKTRECFVKVLKANNKILDEARAQTVGYVYYDTDCISDFFKGKKLPNALQKWEHNSNKRILVLTGFPRAEYTHEELIGMSDYKYHGVKGKEKEYAQEIEYWNDLREKYCEYRSKYLACICELAKNRPDIEILVKLHPVELHDFLKGEKYQCYHVLEQYNNIILLKENVLLGRVLPYADAMVHYGSTSGLEAYICNVPTIQLYDSMYQVKPLEPGFCIYDSTVKLDVNDAKSFEKIVSSGITPRYLESIERVLKEQFNWTNDKKESYHPAKAYAQIILDSSGHGQKISDDEYRLALRSDQGFDVLVFIVSRVFKMMIQRNREKAVKYQKVLKELDVSLQDLVIIMLYKVGKYVKKIPIFKSVAQAHERR